MLSNLPVVPCLLSDCGRPTVNTDQGRGEGRRKSMDLEGQMRNPTQGFTRRETLGCGVCVCVCRTLLIIGMSQRWVGDVSLDSRNVTRLLYQTCHLGWLTLYFVLVVWESLQGKPSQVGELNMAAIHFQ